MSDAPTGTPNEEGVPDGTTLATKWAKPDTTQRGRERPRSPQKQGKPGEEKRGKLGVYEEDETRVTAGSDVAMGNEILGIWIREWKFRGKNPNGRDTLRVAVERRLNGRDIGSKKSRA